MLDFIARRLVAIIPVLAVVAVFVFLMLRLTPGDPAAVIAGDNATSDQIADIREKLGLNQPIWQQFGIWIGNILQGNFGESFFFKKTVAELIAQRIEPTLALATCTLIFAVSLAVPLGVLAAYRQGSLFDRFVMAFSVLGFSVPGFVIGYCLIYVFAIELGWLPVQGYVRIGVNFWRFLERMVLPVAHPVGRLHRADRPHHPRLGARGAERGLYPHRPRQGPVQPGRADAPCAAQRRRADPDRDRPRHRHPDRRRGGDRERVRPARPRPPHRRGGAEPRLPDHPDRHPAVLRGLCA